MKKRYLSLLLALVCAALLTPVWASAADDDEESLRQLLSRQTGQGIFDYFLYGDYDGDGVHEAFALVGSRSGRSENPSGTLWFVSPRYAGEIDEERSYYALETCGGEGHMLFSAEEWYGGSGSTTRLWTVEDSMPAQVENMPRARMKYYGGNEFHAYISEFGINGLGHTWKTYYYFLDGAQMREYGGIYITQEQLLSLEGAQELLQGVTDNGWSIDDVIYRGNGVINVNLRKMIDSQITYSNLTLRREGDRVVDTQDNSVGRYPLANDPDHADYPAAFVPPEGTSAPATASSPVQAVCQAEDEERYSVYLEMDAQRVKIGSFYADTPDEYSGALRVYRLENGRYFVSLAFDGCVYRVLSFEDGQWRQISAIEQPNYSDGVGLRDPDTRMDLYYFSNEELPADVSGWLNGLLSEFFAEDGVTFGEDGVQAQGELVLEISGAQLLAQTAAAHQEEASVDSFDGMDVYRFTDLDPQKAAWSLVGAENGIIEVKVVLPESVYGISDMTMNFLYFDAWSTETGILADAQADLDGDGQDERVMLLSEYLTDEYGGYTRETLLAYEQVNGAWVRQDEFVYAYDSTEPYSMGSRLRLINTPNGMRLAHIEYGSLEGGSYLAEATMYAYDGAAFYISEMAIMDDTTTSFFFKGRIPVDIYAQMNSADVDTYLHKNVFDYLQAHCEGQGTLFEHPGTWERDRTEGFDGVGALLRDYGLELTYQIDDYGQVGDFSMAGGTDYFSVSLEWGETETGVSEHFIRMRLMTELDHFAQLQNPAVTPEHVVTPEPAVETAPPLRAADCDIRWSSIRIGNKYDVRGTTAVDSRLDTAWNTNDVNVGEWISFTTRDGDRQMAGFRIVNGYLKSDETYTTNARARVLKLYCDGDYVESFTIADSRALQTFWLTEPVTGSCFKLVAEQVYRGSKYRDLCITEIELLSMNNEDFKTRSLEDWGRAVEQMEKRLDEGGSLQRGSYSYDVMGLQVLLDRGFGLLDDAADGVFGGNTERALNALMDQMRASSVASQLEPMQDGVANGAFLRNLRLYLQNR